MMSLVVAVALSAAPVGVVIAKRSGVSVAVGAQRAESVREALGPDFADLPVEDLTSCGGKRPCLVREARQRGWSAIVVVETASVLEDALVNVTLLSVEDDGREFARASHQSSDAKLRATLPDALAPLRAELVKLVQKPEAKVLPAPPPPPPQEVAVPAAVSPTRPAARWIPMAVGLVALAGGAGLELASGGVAAELRRGPFVDATRPTELAREGASLQTSGAVLLVAGGALSVGGALLALLWPEPSLSPTVTLGPGGASVGVRGAFP